MLGWLRRYMAFQLLKVTVQTARDKLPSHQQELVAEKLAAMWRDVDAAQAAMTPADFEADLVARLVAAYAQRRRIANETVDYKVDADWNTAHMQETWLGERLALLKSQSPPAVFERVDGLLNTFAQDMVSQARAEI